MKRIAILGGGPIGVEAGVLLAQRGHDVTVFERGAPGAHIAKWGHVRFFSPWSLNRSSWGKAVLEEAGHELPDGDEFPTGAEYLREYLRPLTEVGPIAGRVRHLTEVTAVTRSHAWKGDFIGDSTRGDEPFLFSVSGPDGDEWLEADVVLDASGVYTQPNFLGPGGVAALGEKRAGDFIDRWIPDVLDRDREMFADKRVLVVGDGHSASTSLSLLTELRQDAPGTEVFWVSRSTDQPYVELADDPLPERLELSRFGNRAAAGEVEGITFVGQRPIYAVRAGDDDVTIWFDRTGDDTLTVDRIVANVGYRPNTELTRELQVHHCYASEGPMKLAASLLAQSGSADCLTQESAGVDTLRSPEPDFFVIGAKSYGRNSNFLLRVGFDQIEAIADELEA